MWQELSLHTPCALAPLLAYLDPGTGSFMLQILIASALSGLYATRHWWQQLRLLVAGAARKR
jgi:hypothetical protein